MSVATHTFVRHCCSISVRFLGIYKNKIRKLSLLVKIYLDGFALCFKFFLADISRPRLKPTCFATKFTAISTLKKDRMIETLICILCFNLSLKFDPCAESAFSKLADVSNLPSPSLSLTITSPVPCSSYPAFMSPHFLNVLLKNQIFQFLKNHFLLCDAS